MLHYCTADLRRQGFRSEREAVLLKHGVDLVMTGHSHNYARTCQLNNYTCACLLGHVVCMLCCASPQRVQRRSPDCPRSFLSFSFSLFLVPPLSLLVPSLPLSLLSLDLTL